MLINVNRLNLIARSIYSNVPVPVPDCTGSFGTGSGAKFSSGRVLFPTTRNSELSLDDICYNYEQQLSFGEIHKHKNIKTW